MMIEVHCTLHMKHETETHLYWRERAHRSATTTRNIRQARKVGDTDKVSSDDTRTHRLTSAIRDPPHDTLHARSRLKNTSRHGLINCGG